MILNGKRLLSEEIEAKSTGIISRFLVEFLHYSQVEVNLRDLKIY